jgi:hypothetical protein
MNNYKIKNANACYTGGGIYVYYGELENGLFFRACDGWEFIELCNADTSTEEADYIEFYDEHRVETLNGCEFNAFWNKMLNHIVENRPDGNYQAYELEKRLLKDCFLLSNEGYTYVSENGIEYELLEGLSIGNGHKYTSDIIFICLTDPDYDVNEMVVGYLFGASFFEEAKPEYQESIKEMVTDFEKKNF